MYYSQFKQDQFVNEQFVKNNRDGFFVDIGAHDGITYSNSLFFEKELGWNGICVEPLTKEYNKLTRNRSAITVNQCAFSHDGTVKFTSVQDKQSPQEHSYNMLSGIAETHGTIDRVEKFGLDSTSMDIPCIRLKTLFSEHKIKYVDYLSIDTEGSEFEVLKGIDFSSVHVNLIDVEHNYQQQQMENIAHLLQDNGFQFVRNIECDAFFVNTKLEWSWNQDNQSTYRPK